MSSSYRDLIAWQKSMVLVKDIYSATRDFPSTEVYGLISQIRRAAVSIPCNIAEGQGRTSPGEFYQFLGNARGSLLEVQTLLEISATLDFIQPGELKKLFAATEELRRILSALISSVKSMKAAGV